MDFANLISNLGFPIVCVLGLGYFMKETISNFREDIAAITASRDEASRGMQEAINNNTVVVTKLCTLMEQEKGVVNEDD